MNKKVNENLDFDEIEESNNLAIKYINNKEYDKAIEIFKRNAEIGNAYAQLNLGYCYKNGEGVEQNYIEAFKWYKLAADKGFDVAQYRLGDCYYYGKGVDKDRNEAVKLYLKSGILGRIKLIKLHRCLHAGVN